MPVARRVSWPSLSWLSALAAPLLWTRPSEPEPGVRGPWPVVPRGCRSHSSLSRGLEGQAWSPWCAVRGPSRPVASYGSASRGSRLADPVLEQGIHGPWAVVLRGLLSGGSPPRSLRLADSLVKTAVTVCGPLPIASPVSSSRGPPSRGSTVGSIQSRIRDSGPVVSRDSFSRPPLDWMLEAGVDGPWLVAGCASWLSLALPLVPPLSWTRLSKSRPTVYGLSSLHALSPFDWI